MCPPTGKAVLRTAGAEAGAAAAAMGPVVRRRAAAAGSSAPTPNAPTRADGASPQAGRTAPNPPPARTAPAPPAVPPHLHVAHHPLVLPLAHDRPQPAARLQRVPHADGPGPLLQPLVKRGRHGLVHQDAAGAAADLACRGGGAGREGRAGVEAFWSSEGGGLGGGVRGWGALAPLPHWPSRPCPHAHASTHAHARPKPRARTVGPERPKHDPLHRGVQVCVLKQDQRALAAQLARRGAEVARRGERDGAAGGGAAGEGQLGEAGVRAGAVPFCLGGEGFVVFSGQAWPRPARRTGRGNQGMPPPLSPPLPLPSPPVCPAPLTTAAPPPRAPAP